MAYRLLGCKGCGSAIVEAAFALAGVPLELEEVDYGRDSPTRARLLSLNPLGQVPVLVMPGGEVMTESLAMIQHLDDLEPAAGLVPPKGDPARAAFLRWSTFVVAALYPTFTYGDEPEKWVADPAGAKLLRDSTNRHRQALWRELESVAGAPRFLGSRASALDLYVAAMTRWRPGGKWFEANTPKLWAIAGHASSAPQVAAVMKRNFGPDS